ncbi:hypothetical protein [Stenotrophomonas sp.]|uniref:hypothetical protein n=1 Tax=Stenotrophomonas sp. TaxID=69392 RepID=UPI0028B00CD7|nr:hypothetical protein [Stenotrophomonas sp.]
MERERQEPTVGKVDLKDVSFQPRLRRAQHAQGNADGSEDSKFWLRAIVLLAAVVLIAMGLIEWNARRQVAALERALTITPEQQAAFDAEIRRSAREDAEMLKQLQRNLSPERQDWRQVVEPLKPGQRCIQGRRFERIDGGWRDLPRSPC